VKVLRDGVLEGTAISRAGDGALGRAVAERAAELGASEGADVLVYDPGDAPMLDALDGAWDAIRPVSAAMIEAGGGRILLIAPPPGGAEAEAVRSGLENLARTLSVEWARFQIRPVAILPGSDARSAEVAELACYLASPAGEYYSGCAFRLSGASTSSRPSSSP
jgi:hypothetical protein